MCPMEVRACAPVTSWFGSSRPARITACRSGAPPTGTLPPWRASLRRSPDGPQLLTGVSDRGRASGLLHPAGLRARRVESGPRAVQPALADLGQPLAALPQRQRLLERGAAGLQPLNDLRQLGPRLLVAQLLAVRALVALLLARTAAHESTTLAASSPPSSRTA